MLNIKKFIRASTLALLIPMGIACGGLQQVDPLTGSTEGKTIDYPGWVIKGSGAFGGDQRVFYGVGAIGGIHNTGLAWTAAGDRARNELAKVFEVYSASLMKDYAASTMAGDVNEVSEEQHVVNAIKTFTAETLHGVEVIDRWVHPDGTVFALARLDLDSFTARIEETRELSRRVKDQIKRNAAKAFADLDSEIEKRAEAETE